MFPQPAAVALAVPTTLGENIKEHQNWFVTNVAPASEVSEERCLGKAPQHAEGIPKNNCYNLILLLKPQRHSKCFVCLKQQSVKLMEDHCKDLKHTKYMQIAGETQFLPALRHSQ